ncbi:MAG: hypothetical protein JXQ27_19060 [Acidobacteria bacterium]|nr:hypothetical protein [Acidobacteriota bacterium]
MKMIGLMSLEKDKAQLRQIFEENNVQIFSEMEITGHTLNTITRYGWAASTQDVPMYSSLCFAIIPELEAHAVMDEIQAMARRDTSGHPIRAFQLDVEKMI